MLKELEKTISPVLVVNNSSLKPYVELFEYYPENIYQQPLGSLVGFFEIKEYSEESAYIVNFLTSVLKKEYYANPKRPVAESFDSALHKVNVALSELVKQGNFEWLGKLHAVICVLEKNNAHFSVAGKAKLFLYRNRILSDISDGLASESPEPHPLKTFVNVSSGRLEKGDRILIAPEDIFQILPLTELRKNFQRLEGNKLVQFLKTALSNQLEMIAALVVEMSEAKPAAEVKINNSGKRSPVAANVFSEKTFAKSQSLEMENDKDFEGETDNGNKDSDYTDEKTGHIYVQGEANGNDENSRAGLYWDMVKEKIAQAWFLGKNNLRRRISIYKKQLEKKRELRQIEKEKQKKILAEEMKREQERKAAENIQRELEMKEAEEIRQKQELESALAVQEKQLNEEIVEIEEIKETEVSVEPEGLSFREKLEIAIRQKESSEIIEEDFYTKTKNEKEKKTSKIAAFLSFAKQAVQKIAQASKVALEWLSPIVSKITEKIRSADTAELKKLSRFVPHFSKIKNLFSSFTYRQKIYTLCALVLIFVVPLFIVRFLNRPKPQTITELAVTPPIQTEILAADKNINLTPANTSLLSKNDMTTALSTDAGALVVTKTGIVVVVNGEQKEYVLPADSGNAKSAAYMKDLALVLIMTDQNKVISFSPVSAKFTANNFNLPTDASADFIGTYLTYMYVLDSKNNQIYRYPRATGGFGEKTNWLKDTTSLSGVSDMALDDSIYLIRDNQVLKLFKGIQQSLTLEASKTPVHFDKVYTNINSQSLYILDTKNSRIIQYSKADGNITAQYFNEALKNGTSFSVDEQNKMAYIATSSQLISISLQ